MSFVGTDMKRKNQKFIEPIPYDVEVIAKLTIDSANIVHRKLGPGLKEKTYEKCLALEIRKKGLSVNRQTNLPVIYDGEYLDDTYRVDIIVENKLIVEVKSVERLTPLHNLQVQTYLKISGKHLGLLINFNSEILSDGIKRVRL
jgi:GxxExxY protein